MSLFVIIGFSFFLVGAKVEAAPSNKTLMYDEKEFQRLLEKELKGEEVSSSEGSSFWGQFFRSVFSLGILLALFYGIWRLYILKREHYKESIKGAIEVLIEYPVRPGKFLQVLRIGDRYFLIGVADGGISLLKEWENPAEIESLRLLVEKERSKVVPPFHEKLFSLLKEKWNFTHFSSKGWEEIRKNSLEKLKKLPPKKDFL